MPEPVARDDAGSVSAAVRKVVDVLSAAGVSTADLELAVPAGALDATLGLIAAFAPRARAVAEGAGDARSLFRDVVAALSAAHPRAPPDASPDALRAVHHGVVCDGCGADPIVGFRFKSLTKPDFDLCSACEAKPGTRLDDVYHRVEAPVPRGPGPRGPPPSGFFPFGSPFGGPPAFGSPPPFPPPPHGFWPRRCGRPGGGGPGGWRGCGGGGGWGGGSGGACAPPSPPPPHSAKLDCRFVADVSLFDGTVVPPGAAVVKMWRVRNTGAAPWPQPLRLVRVGGDAIGPAEAEQPPACGGLGVGEEAEVAVDVVAPLAPGRYVSYYRLASPNDVRFGQRVWALIVVADEAGSEGGGGVAQGAAAGAPQSAATTSDASLPDAPPPTAPLPAPVTEEDHEQNIAKLSAMGFPHETLNRAALAASHGALAPTVHALLRMGQQDEAEAGDWVMAASGDA